MAESVLVGVTQVLPVAAHMDVDGGGVRPDLGGERAHPGGVSPPLFPHAQCDRARRRNAVAYAQRVQDGPYREVQLSCVFDACREARMPSIAVNSSLAKCRDETPKRTVNVAGALRRCQSQ